MPLIYLQPYAAASQSTAVGDPYFDKVSLLMHMDGTNGSTTFTDTVSSGRSWTRTGTPAISTTLSKFGGSSLSLGGTSSIQAPASPEFILGTGDFTIEAWVYNTATKLYGNTICGTYQNLGAGTLKGWNLSVNTTDAAGPNGIAFSIFVNGAVAGTISYAPSLSLNTWHHIAATRFNGVIRLWLNGALVGTSSVASNDTFAGNFNIGNFNGFVGTATTNFSGYIDDLRITKGVSRYNTPFTIPASAYPDYLETAGDKFFNNVSLLMHMDGVNSGTSFMDVKGATVSRVGTAVTSTTQSMFGNSSLSLNGSSALTVPDSTSLQMGTGDFTVEMWVQPTATAGSDVRIWSYQGAGNLATNKAVIYVGRNSAGRVITELRGADGTVDQQQTGTTVLTNGTWYHIAFVRANTVTRLFVNGVQEATSTGQVQDINGGAPAIGYYSAGNNSFFTGYIDDLRVTKGVARYSDTFLPPAQAFADYAVNVDPYLDNVGMLLHMNGFAGSGTYADSTNKVITAVGVTSQGAITKFGSSAYFNSASSNYLTTPNHSDFNFGSGDFTMEAWVYPLSFAQTGSPLADQCIIESRNQANAQEAGRYIFTMIPTGAIRFTNATNDTLTTSTTLLTLNSWNHVAVAKQGTTVRVFVNGVVGASSTDNQAYTCGTALAVGALRTPLGGGWTRGFFNGYMDEVRITKGVARYTTAFSIPSSEFLDAGGSTDPYYSNVSMLLHMNGASGSTTFSDSGPSRVSTSITGTTAVSTVQSKFGGTSASIGNGYISAPNTVGNIGTSDFTMEGWFYFTANNVGYQPLFGNTGTADYQGWIVIVETGNTLWTGISNGSGAWGTGTMTTTYTPPINQWVHIALCRVGTTVRLFANGTVVSSSSIGATHTPTGSFKVGQYQYFPGGARSFSGYIDEFRATLGVGRYAANFTVPIEAFSDAAPLVKADPYISNVTLLMHMDGADNGTTFTDVKGKTATRNGTPVTSVTKSVFGNSSLKLNGTTDYLTVPYSSDFDFGTGDFTVECWANLTAIGSDVSFIQLGVGANVGGPYVAWWLRYNSTTGFAFYRYDGTTVTANDFGGSIVVNTWYHIAVSRVGTSLRLFVNGTQVGSTITSALSFDHVNTDPLIIGKVVTGAGTFYANGYIDDVRITKGVGRYTTNFNIPRVTFSDT